MDYGTSIRCCYVLLVVHTFIFYLMDPVGIEPTNLLGANEVLSQLSYRPLVMVTERVRLELTWDALTARCLTYRPPLIQIELNMAPGRIELPSQD